MSRGKKITKQVYTEIKKAKQNGDASVKDMARLFGVHESTIWHICGSKNYEAYHKGQFSHKKKAPKQDDESLKRIAKKITDKDMIEQFLLAISKRMAKDILNLYKITRYQSYALVVLSIGLIALCIKLLAKGF